jgi:hypothetical protein
MRRAGSTLQYQIATELAKRKGMGDGLGYIVAEDFERLRDKHSSDSCLAIVKTHSFLPGADRLIREGKAKALYICRDIRDVLVSLMHMEQVPFSHLREQGMMYVLLKECSDWSHIPGIFTSRYEDVTRDLPSEVNRIAKYLGISLAPGEAQGIADEFSLHRQKQRIKSFDYEKLGKPVGQTCVNPQNLLHNTHIRSGENGQWTSVLTPSEVAVVEHVARAWLREKGYLFSEGWLARRLHGLIHILRCNLPAWARSAMQVEAPVPATVPPLRPSGRGDQ